MQKKDFLAKTREEQPEESYLPAKIAKGKVKKTLFYRAIPKAPGDVTEVAILELEPGAEILQHEHTTDREIYVVGKSCLVCERGETHGYKNRESEMIRIVSIKQAVLL